MISVVTPTYNRAYQIERPFRSLMKQTLKDFEWIVIDDGSDDNTQEIVSGFTEAADFPIIYVKQENCGRAQALNKSYDYIHCEWVINLDSDDELVPTAIETINSILIALNQREDSARFWCITGHCIDSVTRKIIGGQWPENINNLKEKKQLRTITKYKKGEKSCVRRVDILKQNRFPVFVNTNFIPENTVWNIINDQYDQFCVNDTFRVYYQDSADSLSKGTTLGSRKAWSYYQYSIIMVNHLLKWFWWSSNIRLCVLGCSRYGIAVGKKCKDIITEVRGISKLLIIITYPMMKLFVWWKSRHKRN